MICGEYPHARGSMTYKVRILLLSMGGLLILYGFSHSPFFTQALSHSIQSWIRTTYGWNISWSQIKINSTYTQLTLSDVYWVVDGQPFFSSQTIELRLHWWKRPTSMLQNIVMHNPDLSLVRQKNGMLRLPNIPAGGKWEGQFPSITIVRGKGRFHDESTRLSIEIAPAVQFTHSKAVTSLIIKTPVVILVQKEKHQGEVLFKAQCQSDSCHLEFKSTLKSLFNMKLSAEVRPPWMTPEYTVFEGRGYVHGNLFKIFSPYVSQSLRHELLVPFQNRMFEFTLRGTYEAKHFVTQLDVLTKRKETLNIRWERTPEALNKAHILLKTPYAQATYILVQKIHKELDHDLSLVLKEDILKHAPSQFAPFLDHTREVRITFKGKTDPFFQSGSFTGTIHFMGSPFQNFSTVFSYHKNQTSRYIFQLHSPGYIQSNLQITQTEKQWDILFSSHVPGQLLLLFFPEAENSRMLSPRDETRVEIKARLKPSEAALHMTLQQTILQNERFRLQGNLNLKRNKTSWSGKAIFQGTSSFLKAVRMTTHVSLKDNQWMWHGTLDGFEGRIPASFMRLFPSFVRDIRLENFTFSYKGLNRELQSLKGKLRCKTSITSSDKNIHANSDVTLFMLSRDKWRVNFTTRMSGFLNGLMKGQVKIQPSRTFVSSRIQGGFAIETKDLPLKEIAFALKTEGNLSQPRIHATARFMMSPDFEPQLPNITFEMKPSPQNKSAHLIHIIGAQDAFEIQSEVIQTKHGFSSNIKTRVTFSQCLSSGYCLSIKSHGKGFVQWQRMKGFVDKRFTLTLQDFRLSKSTNTLFNIVDEAVVSWNNGKWSISHPIRGKVPGGEFTIQSDRNLIEFHIAGRAESLIKMVLKSRSEPILSVEYDVKFNLQTLSPYAASGTLKTLILTSRMPVRFTCSFRFLLPQKRIEVFKCNGISNREKQTSFLSILVQEAWDKNFEFVISGENTPFLTFFLPENEETLQERSQWKLSAQFTKEKTGWMPDVVLDIQSFDISMNDFHFELLRPVQWVWNKDGFSLTLNNFVLSDIPLRFTMNATTPRPFSLKDWSNINTLSTLVVDGRWDVDLDLNVFSQFVAQALSGRLKGSIGIQGPLTHPLILGELHLQHGMWWNPDWKILVEPMTGKLEINGIERVKLRLSAHGSDGKLLLEFDGGFNSTNQTFNWTKNTISFQSFELFSPLGWKVFLDGQIAWNPFTGLLGGTFQTIRLDSFQPIRLDTLFQQRKRQQMEFDLPLTLDIKIERLIVDVQNNLAQFSGDGSLALHGTLDKPVITGEWVLTDEGLFLFRGIRYRIKYFELKWEAESILPLIKAELQTDIDPDEMPGEYYTIAIRLQGRIDEPGIQFSSEPPLNEDEIIALVTTGSLVRAETGRLAPQTFGKALAYSLGGELSSALLQGIGKQLGLSEIRFQPVLTKTLFEGADVVDPTVRLTLRRQWTRTFATLLSMDVRNTDQQSWILEHEPFWWLTLKGIREDNDTYTGVARFNLQLPFSKRHSRRMPQTSVKETRISHVQIDGHVILPRPSLLRILGIRPPFSIFLPDLARRIEKLETMLQKMGYWTLFTIWKVEPSNEGYKLFIRFQNTERYRWNIPSSLIFLRKPEIRLFIQKTCFTPGITNRSLKRCLRRQVKEWANLQGVSVNGVLVRIEKNAGWNIVTLSVEKQMALHILPVQWEAPELSQKLKKKLRKLCYDILSLPQTIDFRYLLYTKPHKCLDILRSQLHTLGWSIRDIRLERHATSRGLEQTILIFANPPFIRNVTVKGFPGDVSHFVSQLKGRLFKKYEVENAVASLCRQLRNDGYLYAQCTWSWQVPEQTLEVSIKQASKKVPLRTLIFHDSWLKKWGTRYTGLKPGKILTPRLLRDVENRIRSAGIYRRVTLQTTQTDNGTHIEILTQTNPWFLTNLGLRYNSEVGWFLEGTAQVIEPWYSGLSVFSHFLQSRFRKRRSLGIGFPHLIGFPVQSRFFYTTEWFDEETFITEERTWTFEQTIPLSRYISWSHRLRHTYLHIYEKNPGLFPFDFEIRFNRAGATLEWDSREKPYDPHHGFHNIFTVEYAGDILKSELKYFKFFSQVAYFKEIHPRISLTSAIRYGIAIPLDPEDPIIIPSERFYAGGPNSFRALPARQLGPIDPFTGTPAGGEVLFLVNLEAHFHLTNRFSTAFFMDIGNIFKKHDAYSLSLSALRKAVGIGIRYESPIGFVRIDLGYLLDPGLGEKRWRPLFAIGPMF